MESDKIVSPRREYQKIRIIGHGKYGEVCQILDLGNGQISAIKVMENANLSSRNEPRIIERMDHPNIIKKLDDWNKDNVYYLVTEYADLGDLKEYIISKNKIGEDEVRDIFKQIVNGMKYAHQNLICHRDLKLENIVLFKDDDSPRGKRIAIIDWGLATSFSYLSLRESFCGTLPYTAPEILNKQQYIGPEVDVWSLGIVLYFILTKHFPFGRKDINSIKYKIYFGHSPIPSTWSPELKDLLSKLLAINANDRINVQDILDHPWITEVLINVPNQGPRRWKRIYQDGVFFVDSKLDLSDLSDKLEGNSRNSKDIITRDVNPSISISNEAFSLSSSGNKACRDKTFRKRVSQFFQKFRS